MRNQNIENLPAIVLPPLIKISVAERFCCSLPDKSPCGHALLQSLRGQLHAYQGDEKPAHFLVSQNTRKINGHPIDLRKCALNHRKTRPLYGPAALR
jgi:hypothetical protein